MVKRLLGLIIILALIAAGIAVWLLTHPALTDREQILRLISQAEEGVETKNSSKVMDCISQDYQDRHGFRKRDLARYVIAFSRQSKGDFDVTLGPPSLTITDDHAVVQLMVTIRPMMTPEGSPPALFEGPVTAHLRKEDAGWKVMSAEGWEEGPDLLP